MPSNVPRVSVVMPVYNNARYLRQAVQSILDQTLRELELIVVDDGSTDRSAQILQQLAAHDKRLLIIRRPNTGVAQARQDGLKVARAPLLAAMDADDVAAPQRLQVQADYMDAHPDCVLLGAAVRQVDWRGRELFVETLPLDHAAIDARLLQGAGGTIRQPVAMMRTAAMHAVHGYDRRYRVAEDLDLFLRLAEHGQVANLPDVLLDYRQHPRSSNYTQWQLEHRFDQQILDEAYRRRYGAQATAPQLKKEPPLPRRRMYLLWGWYAIRGGRRGQALCYALRALAAGAWTREAARLLAASIRG